MRLGAKLEKTHRVDNAEVIDSAIRNMDRVAGLTFSSYKDRHRRRGQAGWCRMAHMIRKSWIVMLLGLLTTVGWSQDSNLITEPREALRGLFGVSVKADKMVATES